jgi:hypothetical protein
MSSLLNLDFWTALFLPDKGMAYWCRANRKAGKPTNPNDFVYVEKNKHC